MNNLNINVKSLSKRAVGMHFLDCLREAREKKWTTPNFVSMYCEILASLSDAGDMVQLDHFIDPLFIFDLLDIEPISDVLHNKK